MTTPDAIAPNVTPALSPTVDPALLAWFGDTTFPDGGDDARPLTQPEWEGVYARLVAAARAPGLVQPLFLLEAPLPGLRPDGPVPIAVADLPVATADPDEARRAAERAFAGGAPVDAADLLPNAHRARAFAAAALLHEQWGRATPTYRGRDVTYALDERFWVALPKDARPDSVTLDPGDGGGPRPVALGGSVTASYAADATSATATLRARYGDETRTARFTLAIGGPPAAPPPDDVWPLRADAPDESPVTGRASVWRGAGHADVVHPIIVGEGFPGGYAPDYMYDVLNQAGLADALRARGYDVVVLHYDAGTDPIQRNARLMVACIAEARRRTARPLVVGGVSMGGLVARYALTWMEAHGVEHGAHTFLTIDTPHGGAYTAIADQWFAQFLAAASPLAATMAGALATPANQQFVARSVLGRRVAPSPLRTVFLAELRALGDWPRVPRRLATASGQGRGAAAESTPRPHRRSLLLEGAPFAAVRLHTLPSGGETAVVATGRSAVRMPNVPDVLSVTSDIAWEDVPGATNTYTGTAAGIALAMACGPVTCDAPVSCSVPTVSALALDQDPRSPVPPPSSGRSPFHDYVCSDRDEPHVTIPPATAAWILDRLGMPNAGPTSPGEPPMTAAARPDAPAAYAPATPAPAAAPPIDPAKVDLHAPSYLADPFPTYAALRAGAPVAPLAPYPGVWAFRYADVTAALKDADTFLKNPVGGAPPLPGVLGALGAMPNGVFSSDPPRHTALRAALEPPLRAAFARAPQVAGAVVDQILGGIRAGGTRRVELMSDYALAVPSTTLFALLGLRDVCVQDDPTGAKWKMLVAQLVSMVTAIAAANDITQSVAVQTMGGMSAMALTAFCQGVLRRVASTDGDTVLHRMLANAAAAGFGPDDVQSSLVNFIVAGYLSTTFLIGTGVLNLLRNPDQLALLRAEPSRIDAAVQEMLRHDAPAQLVDRVVARDTSLGGTPLAQGTVVKLVIGSANRDETVFADPDRFDIARQDGGAAVPFGAGIHNCMGAPLVCVVAPIAIGRLVEALPNLALDGLVTWQTDPYLRSPASLPLRI